MTPKEQLEPNEYKCASCGIVYEKGWTDEEAKQEAEEIFGKHPDDWNSPQKVVCDDCFQETHPLKNPDLLEETKKQI